MEPIYEVAEARRTGQGPDASPRQTCRLCRRDMQGASATLCFWCTQRLVTAGRDDVVSRVLTSRVRRST
jgi:hypothetical protein